MSESEEGDPGVSRELEAFDAERFRAASAHLELMWNVAKVGASRPRLRLQFGSLVARACL